MAFVSMFLVFIAAIFIGLAIVFTIGLILFLVGVANKKKVKNSNKKWPFVLIILGWFNMVPPLIIAIILAIFVSVYNYDRAHMLDKYATLPEAWEHVEVIDTKAANQALELLFDAADNDDRDGFTACFSNEIRNDPGFEDAANAFLEAYPGGFSGAEFTYHGHGGATAGNGWKGAKRQYECDVNGVHYYVTVGFCYHSRYDQDIVGVNYLTVMNVGGEASFSEDEDIYLLCFIPGEDEVNARRIDGYAFLWEDTEGPVMTADEMREYLAQFVTLREAIDAGGMGYPNCTDNINRNFYELKPVNGEPRYAVITTAGEYGRIIQAVECTGDSSDYDNMIVPFRSSE